ncbi:MAG: sulfite reductase subunit alpha [Pseudomonadota bacterium]
MINVDPSRWAIAASMLAAYALMCVLLWRARLRTADAGAADWLVAYASQTGTGEYLAQQTVTTLRTGGLSARSASFDQIDEQSLRGASRMLFIASTYGEGDAPDSAERFARLLASASDPLAQLHYGLLALGDSSYTHFCGFGRRLDAALQARGAQPLFARVEADRAAPAALDAWRHHLSHLAGTADAPDWSAPAYASWRLASRTLLNPGSAGAPVYRIGLVPADGPLPAWEPGDLVQVSAPGDPDYPREYSIASIRAEGELTLLVRLHLHADGSAGHASGWLGRDAAIGDPIALRIRVHSRFQIGDNAERPLILIGNGTGIAGLRAHLQCRAMAGQGRNWLLFGERSAAHDDFCGADIAAWRAAGMLERLDLTYSRDGAPQRYVQDALTLHAGQLRDWVASGAAIYVCGSLHGMAAGVHAALADALGEDSIEQLASSGRYRRDVY